MEQSRDQKQHRPRVIFLEQPVSDMRMRYGSEGSSSVITGASSTPKKRSYPAIKVMDYEGNVFIVLSCVTKDRPYRQHPHKLISPHNSRGGVFSVRTMITEDNNVYQFRNLGIQIVKWNDIGDALRDRHSLRVDPFKAGFQSNRLARSDMKAVRLACQVLLADAYGKVYAALPPIVSNAITNDGLLCIKKVCRCFGSARGGGDFILLCEKVDTSDIEIVFFEPGTSRWKVSANILSVHKSVAIQFRLPPYRNPDISKSVNVCVQLRRLSDMRTSNSVDFEYIPHKQARLEDDPQYLETKAQKTLLPWLSQLSYEDSNSSSTSHASQHNWPANINRKNDSNYQSPFRDLPWSPPEPMEQALSHLQPLVPEEQPSSSQHHRVSSNVQSLVTSMSPAAEVLPSSEQLATKMLEESAMTPGELSQIISTVCSFDFNNFSIGKE